MDKPRILCIGSAHLDIVSHVSSDEAQVEQVGTTSVEVGGTACNVSINLARLGARVTLLTALDGGALSDVIVRHVADSGVQTRILRKPGGERSVAALSVHINERGAIQSAIASLPVERVRFPAEKIKGEWDAVFIDTNLHPREIERIARKLAGVPVFIGSSSDEKAVRMIDSLPFSFGVFVASKDVRYIKKQTGYSSEDMAQHGCTVFNYLGTDGVSVVEESQSTFVQAPQIIRSPTKTGAIDALTASTIYHLCLGSTMVESVRASMGFAVEVAKNMVDGMDVGSGLDRVITDFRRQAFVDTLTDIPNRSAGIRRAAEISRDQRDIPCAVVMIDIDNFKSINDAFGHDSGDEVLKLVGLAISTSLRENDFGCRWGGEEFACFMEARDPHEAFLAGERIRQQIANIVDGPCMITASLGIAMWIPSWSLDDALSRADICMYTGKKTGKNRVIVEGYNETSAS